MKTIQAVSWQIIGVTVSLFLGVGLLPVTAHAGVRTVDVNCADGDTITDALTEGTPGKQLIVNVMATCTEHVTITLDDVTLRGRPGMGDTVEGPDPNRATILVDGVQRVTIENLTVTHVALVPVVGFGGSGISVINSAEAQIDSTTVENNSGFGISVSRNSTATITASNIRGSGFYGVLVVDASSVQLGFLDAPATGNVIRDNTRDGILATRVSSVRMFGNDVRDNGRNGVLLTLGSTARMFGANTIRDNGSNGVFLSRASSLQTGGTDIPLSDITTLISDNTGSGIFAGDNSSVVFRSGTVSGNGLPSSPGGPARGNGITLNRQSSLDMSNSEVSGNGGLGVGAANNSSVVLRPGATVSGNRGGILLRFNSSLSMAGSSSTVRDVEVSGNGRTGILSLSNGSLEIRNATIRDNEFSGIQVQLHSSLQINNSTISGHTTGNGILVIRDSALELGAGMNFFGNATDIRCGDMESSVIDTATGVPPVGPGVVNCTGF